jgi:hypothetical protein
MTQNEQCDLIYQPTPQLIGKRSNSYYSIQEQLNLTTQIHPIVSMGNDRAMTFEEAIAYTENLRSRTDLDDAQLQSEITNLVKTANGARGFFVYFLTGEWELAENPSPAIVQALQAEPKAIAELLVKNLAMSTAMAITHRRNGDEEKAQGSDRVARRTALLIEKVDLQEVRAIAKQMQDSVTSNNGDYATFLEKWGYDAEQKQAIADILS